MNLLTNGGGPSVSVDYYVHQYDAWHPKGSYYNKPIFFFLSELTFNSLIEGTRYMLFSDVLVLIQPYI